MKACCDMNELDKIAYEMHKKIFAQIIEDIDSPVTSTQIYMLNYIRSQGECMVTDIANYLCVTLGAVTSLVDKLYDFGFVSRARSEVDRRLVIIKLSEKGEEQLNKIDMRRKQVLSSVLEGMEQEEIAYLKAIMEKMVTKILNS